MNNIALIGISGYGASHLKLILEQQAAGNARLIAATVINRSETEDICRELEAAGCTVYTDYRDMLRAHQGTIDLCCVPTGIHWHTAMTVDALQAGANVLVEKPIAATLQDVNAMREASARAGKFVAVGFQLIYHPDIHRLKKALIAGKMGKIKSIKTLGFFARKAAYYARNNWAGKLKANQHWVLDSPANNALAHPLNLMLFMAGETFGESALPYQIQAEMYRSKPIESFDTVSLKVITRENVEILYYVTHSCPESRETIIEINCENGHIRFNSSKGFEFFDSTGRPIEMPEFDNYLVDPRSEMMQAVLQKIKTPDTFVCSPDIAAMHTLCINAMHQFFPIHDVDNAFIQHKQDIITIDGIEDTLNAAFERCCLLSEMDTVAWAKPSKQVSIEDYKAFGGIFPPVTAGV